MVYAHINKKNKKAYIGITCQKLARRWGSDGKGYKKQEKFYNAIQKYGWDNFEHIVLEEEIETEEDALEIETEYIVKYDSINNGYNILKNGIKSYPRYKKVFCLTTKKLYNSIIEAATENNVDPYRIILNCKGKNSHTKGVTWAYWDEEKKCCINKPIFEKKYHQMQ